MPKYAGNDGTCIDEAELEKILLEDSQKCHVPRTWQERQVAHGLAWEAERKSVHERLVSSQKYCAKACDKCFMPDNTARQAVRCHTCMLHLCFKCDFEKHSREPFHKRMFVSKTRNDVLLPTEFFDNWRRFEAGESKPAITFVMTITKIFVEVCVPCFIPPSCENCSETGTLSIMPNNQDAVVVTTQGSIWLIFTLIELV